jgi:hypothetical protein
VVHRNSHFNRGKWSCTSAWKAHNDGYDEADAPAAHHQNAVRTLAVITKLGYNIFSLNHSLKDFSDESTTLFGPPNH